MFWFVLFLVLFAIVLNCCVASLFCLYVRNVPLWCCVLVLCLCLFVLCCFVCVVWVCFVVDVFVCVCVVLHLSVDLIVVEFGHIMLYLLLFV